VTVIRLDATIAVAHSDKQQARGTFKGTYGHHPLTAWCDNTDESPAVQLRPGNAGSNTAADHIAIVDVAIAQIPAKHRRKMLFTRDGVGSTHALVKHVTRLGARPGYQVHYSAGFDFDEGIRAVLPRLPESAWTPALDAGGMARPDAQVAKLTGLLRHSAGGDRLAGWPADMRILIRRENPASRCSAVLVRTARGQALAGHRHQYPSRADPVPRSPPQNPGKSRRQHPLREKHRPGTPAVP
jgi:DDE family transposase